MKTHYHIKQKITILVLLSILPLITGCQRNDAHHSIIRKRFQVEIEKIREQYNLPGITGAYILEDGTTEVFAAGFSDREHGIPMSNQSRMPGASIGKTFTGAEILALVNEEKLDLDIPIKRYLAGEKWLSRLANNNRITLRHLLTHTSGIGDHVKTKKFITAFHNNRGIGAEAIKPRELIACILDISPLCEPGEEFHYSDTGYIIAGLIIENVTDRSFYEKIESRFLKPQGLTMTAPSNTIHLPGLASGYLSQDNIFKLPPKTTVRPGVMAWNPGVEWAGGGFITTSHDLALWGKKLYEGSVIPGNYLKDLTQSVKVRDSLRYGIATVIYEDRTGGTSYGHSGWIPGYCSSMRYYTQYKTAIAFQINTDIGIIDASSNVLNIMEERLAEAVFNPAGQK